MRTAHIFLSVVPRETLTIHTFPLWENMLHLLNQFSGDNKKIYRYVKQRHRCKLCIVYHLRMEEIHHALNEKQNVWNSVELEAPCARLLDKHKADTLCLQHHNRDMEIKDILLKKKFYSKYLIYAHTNLCTSEMPSM